MSLLASGDVRPVGVDRRPLALDAVDLASDAAQRFVVRHGEVEVGDAVEKALLVSLAECYPQATRTPELAARVANRLRAAGQPALAEEANFALRVAERLLPWQASGAVTLEASQSPFTLAPGERPVASVLARYEAARGWAITSLLHHHVKLADPTARQLLGWLDGGQSRAELAARLAQPALRGEATIEIEGRRLVEKREIRAAFTKFVDDCLQRFARDGLLIA